MRAGGRVQRERLQTGTRRVLFEQHRHGKRTSQCVLRARFDEEPRVLVVTEKEKPDENAL